MRIAIVLALLVSTASADPARKEFRVEGTPMNMLADHSTIVWTTSAGEIWTRPAAGGRMHQLTEQHEDGIAMALAHVGDRWFAAVDNDIERVDLDSGELARFKLELPGDLIDLVSDATALYAVQYKRHGILRIPVDGGKPTTVFSLPSAVIAISPDGTTLAAASYSTGELVTHATRGGKLRTIASHLPKPVAVALDATFAYVSCETDGSIRRIELATGKSIVLAHDLDMAKQLVADGPWLYTYEWHGAQHGTLLRIAKAGDQPPEVIADGMSSPYHIAVSDDAVYVTNRDAGTIVRVDKQ